MEMIMSNTSHDRARDRFSDRDVAEKYPRQYRDEHQRDSREKNAILAVLPRCAKNAKILDFPCGTGRLTRLLLEQGYTSIHCADISPAMISKARNNFRNLSSVDKVTTDLTFEVADVMATAHSDKAFDLIVCNRLFHHFTEQATRLKALRELRRICNGYLVVSFFNSFSLSAVWKASLRMLKGNILTDRIPIAMTTFQSELTQAGFKVRKKLAVQWGVSPHWYILAEPVSNK